MSLEVGMTLVVVKIYLSRLTFAGLAVFVIHLVVDLERIFIR